MRGKECKVGIVLCSAVHPIKHTQQQPATKQAVSTRLFVYLSTPFPLPSPLSHLISHQRESGDQAHSLATVVLATDTALERPLLGMTPLVPDQVLGLRKSARAEPTRLAYTCA